MCGIAGYVSLDGRDPVDPAILSRMIRTLQHRGPDDEGIWTDGRAGLANRRLAVIDLSPHGHQPMTNEDGSLWIAFNGEVYNFQDLRHDLERKGHVFRSNSDTEVILHLYEEEGAACLERLRGMFALAIWDTIHRRLFLARDRLGKKPLFYYHDDHCMVFGSEPKALHEHPAVPRAPDLNAIDLYLTYGYVPGPWAAFQGMRKLLPGHFLVADDNGVRVDRYWRLHYLPKRTDPEPALVEELTALLEEAVRLRMISDVPLGALLSGGLDSSAVVAMMRRLTSGPIKTFSIGFENPQYDELAYARQVARQFETDHHELIVRPDVTAILPQLVWHYNEPFADSSALPSFAVCEMARASVTVALNGDGGDESFLGYDRYLGISVASYPDRLPRFARLAIAGAGHWLPLGLPKSRAYRLRRFCESIALPPRVRYARWIGFFDEEAKAALYEPDFARRIDVRSFDVLDAAYESSDAPGFLEASAHVDIQTNLPDDLLVKMDIASMAHSLELRSPFLDHKIVEFAASLPAAMKLRRLTQKYLLKRAMSGLLPDEVVNRKKMGFGVPLASWFRHELRDLAYDVLLSRRATDRGYFRMDVVRRYLDEHSSGRAHHHFRLWNLLLLELWHERFVDESTRPDSLATPSRPAEALAVDHSQ